MTLQAVDLQCVRGGDVLFEGLEFTLDPGRVLVVQGRNGAGKTSLLRILSGIGEPAAGQVLYRGTNVRSDRQSYWEQMIYVGHRHGVKAALSPLENLRATDAVSGRALRTVPENALERIGLTGYEDVPCARLSAGQRRRVALARLLTTEAEVWLLDEPLTAIDRTGVQLVESLLESHLAAGGLAVVTSHHDIALPVDRVRPLSLG